MRTVHGAPSALLLLLAACASASSVPRPESYYSGASREDDGRPLFKSDGAVLSDADIERILNRRLALPKQSRLAILSLSSSTSSRFFSSDIVHLNDAIEKEFIGVLKKSGRLYDASFLPTLLVPENRTVPYLREAAARCQADLLLAYRSRCASYEKVKLFGTDETRAYCSVEAVVLDVRTGIVAFTAVSTNDVNTAQGADDKTLAETTRKNELVAVGKSLAEIGRDLVRFLDGTPPRP